MADKPKTSGLDYGHRTYMDADDYTSAMARGSDKNIDNKTKRSHSDDKKPYMGDEYPEMEHFFTPYDPPNFVPPGIPDDPRIVPRVPGGPGADLAVLYCQIVGCFVENETTCLALNCTYTPIAVMFAHFHPPGVDISLQGKNICITATSASPPAIEVDVLMSGISPDGRKLLGTHDSIMITKCPDWETDPEPVNCEDADPLEWDTENSAETIIQDGQATVYVTGGVGLFTWTVSGTGYTLSARKTSGRANTIHADETSCGTATITCTDECDTQVEGTLRNVTAGKWGPLQSPVCGLAGVQCDPDPYNNYYGNYGYIQMYATSGGGKQMHTHYYDLYGGAFFTDGGSLEANIANCIAAQTCGGAFDTGCLEFPSQTLVQGTGAKVFIHCGASNIFYWPCEASGYSNWARGWKLVFRSLPAALNYWDWICP